MDRTRQFSSARVYSKHNLTFRLVFQIRIEFYIIFQTSPSASISIDDTKHVEIKFSAHVAFPEEKHSSGTINAKIYERQIIIMPLEARQTKDLNRIA